MTRSRPWLVGIAAVGVGAVGAALATQHLLGMQPCPWCILQRVIFLAIAAVALIGAALPAAALRRAAAAIVVALAAWGVATALWQHFVAAASTSCNLTFADRFVNGIGLAEAWPEVFMATATCAEARAWLLGIPYEFYSLALFVATALVAGAIALPALRRRIAGRPH